MFCDSLAREDVAELEFCFLIAKQSRAAGHARLARIWLKFLESKQ